MRLPPDGAPPRAARRNRVARKLRRQGVALGRIGDGTDRLRDEQGLAESLERPRRQRRHRDGPVERHETRELSERQMQRRDVRVAHEDLGIAADQAVVDPVEQTLGAVAAAQAEDRGDLRIGEHRVQVRQTLLLRAREVPAPRADVRAELRLQAESREARRDVLDPPEVEHVGGRRDEADRVAGLQRPRPDHRRGRRRGRRFRLGQGEERAAGREPGRREKRAARRHAEVSSACRTVTTSTRPAQP